LNSQRKKKIKVAWQRIKPYVPEEKRLAIERVIRSWETRDEQGVQEDMAESIIDYAIRTKSASISTVKKEGAELALST